MSGPGVFQEALAARLRAVESRNLTWVGPGWPIFWTRAVGSEVWDAEGQRYIDFSSAFGVASIGHAHPDVASAVSAQSRDLVHGMGDVHPPELKLLLLERLAALFPWPTRTILGLNGSDAVEAGLKTALLATGRPGVVALEGAYHGLGYGAMQLTWRREFRDPFRAQSGGFARFIPFPVCGGFPEPDGIDALVALDRELARGDVGAVIVEPIQGRGGIRVPPAGWLRTVAARTRVAGALLLCDEIMTGFGRTGALFRCLEEGVEPDLVMVGKALGGGLPLSACVGRADVMNAWPESTGEAIHTATFLGSPLSCRAALATLDVLEREQLVARSATEGAYVLNRLAAWGARGNGLMIGIPLRDAPTAHRVVRACLANGLILLADGVEGNVVELLPPLNIPRALLDDGLTILEEALAAVA